MKPFIQNELTSKIPVRREGHTPARPKRLKHGRLPLGKKTKPKPTSSSPAKKTPIRSLDKQPQDPAEPYTHTAEGKKRKLAHSKIKLWRAPDSQGLGPEESSSSPFQEEHDDGWERTSEIFKLKDDRRERTSEIFKLRPVTALKSSPSPAARRGSSASARERESLKEIFQQTASDKADDDETDKLSFTGLGSRISDLADSKSLYPNFPRRNPKPARQTNPAPARQPVSAEVEDEDDSTVLLPPSPPLKLQYKGKTIMDLGDSELYFGNPEDFRIVSGNPFCMKSPQIPPTVVSQSLSSTTERDASPREITPLLTTAEIQKCESKSAETPSMAGLESPQVPSPPLFKLDNVIFKTSEALHEVSMSNVPSTFKKTPSPTIEPSPVVIEPPPVVIERSFKYIALKPDYPRTVYTFAPLPPPIPFVKLAPKRRRQRALIKAEDRQKRLQESDK